MLTYFLLCAVKSDLETRMIPDEVSIAVCILAVGSGGFSLSYVALGIFVMLVTALVMGLGDAKLFASLSLLLGPKIIYVIAASFFTAFIYCAAALICGDIRMHDEIPFAPFIAIPACALWYNNLMLNLG